MKAGPWKSLGISTVMISAVIVGATPAQSKSAELHRYINVRLVDSSANDGDSFVVLLEDASELHVRLYYVDCPESYCPSRASEQARVREQTRYFGLPGIEGTILWGERARDFTLRALAEPFVLYTSRADAGNNRVYGFITTSGGKDLARELLSKGLARDVGVRRRSPSGVSAEEMHARYADVEAGAMLANSGVWSESRSDLLEDSRALQRKEDREFEKVRVQLKAAKDRDNRIDINSASEEELQSLKGIGSVLAARIVEYRQRSPFTSVDDLLHVKGIGRNLVEDLRPFVVVSGRTDVEE